MFGMKTKKKDTVTISKEKYEWMVEKIKERQEYKRDAEVARWNQDVAMRGLRMSPSDWNLYHDFIKHRWYSLNEETRARELAFADAMSKFERDEEGYMAFAQFVNSLHDLEFYGRMEENK